MENLIECLECGNQYKRVSTTHLKKHSMSYDDYFAKYPGVKIEHPNVTEARKQTLDNMIKRYGETKGLERWKLYCDRQAETNTFEYKNFRYGMTLDEFDEYNKSRTRAMLKASNKSFKANADSVIPFKIPEHKFTYQNSGTLNFGYIGRDYYKTRHREKIEIKGASNYNPDSIPIIEEYGRLHGYEFQHAENGGEVMIYRYHIDAFDFKNKIVLEYNEQHHMRPDSVKYDAERLERIKNRLGPGWTFVTIWFNGNIDISHT